MKMKLKQIVKVIVIKKQKRKKVYKSKFKCIGKEEITLKKFVIDELGISNFVKNGFNPDYHCYYTDNEFVVRVECPGNGVKLTGKRRRNRNRNGIDSPLYYIEINGERKETLAEEEKIVKFEKERKNGTFYLLIPFYNEEYALEKCTSEELKKRSSTFRFHLAKYDDEQILNSLVNLNLLSLEIFLKIIFYF